MKRELPKLLSFPHGSDCTILNLGAGNAPIRFAVGLDLPDWDADCMRIPYEDESVDGIHAYHFLEHVKNPISMLLEIQRVLKPGSHINIVVPYYTSSMAVHDLTHEHFFCEDTWKTLFDNPYTSPQVKERWRLKVHANFIMGIVQRNLALFTQLIKTR